MIPSDLVDALWFGAGFACGVAYTIWVFAQVIRQRKKEAEAPWMKPSG